MSTSPRRVQRVLVLPIAALLVATLGAPASAAQVVKMTNTNRYKPAALSINKGVKVVWKNPSNRAHNVTAYKGNWNLKVRVNPGDQASFTFNNNGVYKYRCTLQSHSTLVNGNCSGMCGRITVG